VDEIRSRPVRGPADRPGGGGPAGSGAGCGGGAGARGGAVAGVRIRRLGGGDLPAALATEREAFPDDPWTLESAGGWLARSPFGRNARYAARLERLIWLSWLREVIHLIRLSCFVALKRPRTRYYIVAEAGGAVAGYACLSITAAGTAVGTGAGTGEVQTMAVRPGREGQGIGTAMLGNLIAAAAARGCREVFLHVRADNDRARQLYLRTGFTDVGVRPGYYQPSGSDAVVMRLPLQLERGQAVANDVAVHRAAIRR
jgi:ribosomal-protein-alanine N-acetyltransferase